jgi:hypothetical protein
MTPICKTRSGLFTSLAVAGLALLACAPLTATARGGEPTHASNLNISPAGLISASQQAAPTSIPPSYGRHCWRTWNGRIRCR